MYRSSMVCLDANLIVRLIVGDASPRIQEFAAQWNSDGRGFVAPSLIGYEVTNALHRIRLVAPENLEIDEAMRSYELMSIELIQDRDLHIEALQFADRFRLPAAYDCHYLALANRLGIEFWTADRKLHRAVSNELPWARLVE